MPTRTNTLLTILLAAAAGSATAAPYEPGSAERFPISINDAETRLQERLAELDTDGSETISLSEFEQADAPITHHGKRMQRRHRGEGRKAAHRFRLGAGERAERLEAHREAMQAEVFAILDSDGDGAISESEHAAADPHEVRTLARKRTLFKRLDDDADGLLQFSELAHRLEKLRAADSDGDGLVSREEMRSHHVEQRRGSEASSNG